MKTLSDMKRDIKIGQKWEVVSCNGKPPADKISGDREIVHIQSNSIAFKREDKPKSWLQFPPASLLEYSGDEIKIYEPGYRPLTEAEQSVVDNMPSHRQENGEAVERDLLSDGSSTYWMDKKYTKEAGADWYWSKCRGLTYRHATSDEPARMRDEKIKGVLSLHYRRVSK